MVVAVYCFVILQAKCNSGNVKRNRIVIRRRFKIPVLLRAKDSMFHSVWI